MRPLEYHQPSTPAAPQPRLLMPSVCAIGAIGLLLASVLSPHGAIVTVERTAGIAVAATGLMAAQRALDTACEWVITAAMGLLIVNALVLLSGLLIVLNALG